MSIYKADWIVTALDDCAYPEDVQALKHFVFHPRHNGASNTCLVCGYAVATEDPYWSDGHASNCAYLKAVLRWRNAPTLAAWIERA